MQTSADKKGVGSCEKEVSSAEITGVYRCVIPEFSGDTLSDQLVSDAGRYRANAFIEKYQYPLVNQKISLRAGYCLNEAVRLLSSDHYDACISLASGFSLLLYYIAGKTKNMGSIQYFDTDFAHMIQERQQRMSRVKSLDQAVLSTIKSKACDVEKVYQDHVPLKTIFPSCKRPICIAEGLTYFLSPGCVEWLIKQIGAYEHSAAILDYWPDDMLQTSTLFARVFRDLNQGMILEPLKSFWSIETITHFRNQFSHVNDYSLPEVEKILSSQPRKPEMTDPNQYFPLRMITGEK